MAKTDLLIRVLADVSKMKKGISRANKQIDTLKKTAMRAGAAMGVAFGGAEVAAAVRESVTSLANLEFQMSKVAAISRAMPAEFKALRDNALELGATSQFTAQQIGEMQEELARLGRTPDEILSSTQAIKDLALASGEQLAPAAQAMTATMKAFGIEANESGRVANVMAESFSMSALNMEKFRVSMSFTSAAAKAAGFSIEETTAALATLTDRGIESSKAGTALRKIFTTLAVKGINYKDAMDQIKNSTNQNRTAFELFGQTASNQALILANNQGSVERLTAKFSDNKEEMWKMVDVMEDNLITDYKLLISAIDGFIQSNSDLLPVIRDVVVGMTVLVKQFSFLYDKIKPVLKVYKYINASTAFYLKILGLLKLNTWLYNDAVEDTTKKHGKATPAAQAYFEIMGRSWDSVNDGAVTSQGLIDTLQEKLKGLQEQQKKAWNIEDLIYYNREIEKTQNEIQKLLKAGLEDPLKDFGDPEPVEKLGFSLGGLNMKLTETKGKIKGVKDEVNTLPSIFQNMLVGLDEMGNVFVNLNEAFSMFAETMAISLGEALGDAISGVGHFGASILKAVGGFMQQLGKMMISTAVATDKFKATLIASPGAALAAGIALVAIGKAFTNKAQAMTQNMGGGGVGSSASRASMASLEGIGVGNMNLQPIAGNWKISGQDLLFIQEKAKRNQGSRG